MKELLKSILFICLITLTLSISFTQNAFSSRRPLAKDSVAEQVKGLYVSGWNIGNPEYRKYFINLANRTEINTYVIDIKEDDGCVSYPSEVKEVKKLGNWKLKYDPKLVLTELHQNHIRVIGRIVCFKDPLLPLKNPDLALKTKSGEVWKDRDGLAWINPYKKANWEYLVNIAKEAVKLGFDEIQFDYIRFSGDKDLSNVDFGETKLTKYEAINGFLGYARKKLPKTILSADVFGIICESPEDMEGIGQYLELIGKDIDYISPMIYASHYAFGQIINGVEFPKPDLAPYGLVFNALSKTKSRITPIKNYRASVRPYLQDFTSSYLGDGNFQPYGADQIRQQIKAVYDAGYHSWLFWNYTSQYSETGFLPKK